VINVLVAGLGGASLGLEIVKALRLTGDYRIVGCDISPLAFGLFSHQCDVTALVRRDVYVEDVLQLCADEHITAVCPGGEEQMNLLAAASTRFVEQGIVLATNDPAVVASMGDKARCFEMLARLGVRIPVTMRLDENVSLRSAPYPCVIKPATESGGSAFVFYARDQLEAELYAEYLKRNGKRPILQEYIPHEPGGEFTVGVLSAPDASIIGSIALKRLFPAKLSVAARGPDFLISSGFSQGHIGDYPDVRATATTIAQAVGSSGPLNVQGRIDREGRFVPFEINPRFSASTYLRALAGFNEIDLYLRRIVGLPAKPPERIREGYYLRGLTEVAVAPVDSPA